MPIVIKDIKIDNTNRDWVEEYRAQFDNLPIIYHLIEIMGSSNNIATKYVFNFPKYMVHKPYKFAVSWNDDGLDDNDLNRLQFLHSSNNKNKKGQSARGRGLRCVIENFYTNIKLDKNKNNEIDLSNNEITTILSKTKNGKIKKIQFYPEMQIGIEDGEISDSEKEKFNEHMLENFNDNVGIYCEFVVNKNLVYDLSQWMNQIFLNKMIYF